MKLLVTFFILIALYCPIHSQIFVKSNATGNNDGTSWLNAFKDLQDAIDVIQPGDQIWIAAGTYVPSGPTPDSSHFLAKFPVELYGGFVGTETNLSQRDWKNNLSILSGDRNGNDVEGDFFNMRNDNAHHVLIIDAGDSETILDGLVFNGGSTRVDAYNPDSGDMVGYNRWRGGALYFDNSSGIIRNCTFKDNHGYQGSSLFAKDSSSISNDLTIENSTFEFNSVLNGGTCMVWPLNNFILKHSVFNQNEAGTFGGGLVIFNTNSIVEDCEFNQNFASGGGGACYISHNNSSVNLYPHFNFLRCFFTGNNTFYRGGAFNLYNYANSFELTFDSCTFAQNNTFGNDTIGSGSSGGAILVSDYADASTNEPTNMVRIDHTTFSINLSNSGGAVAIYAGDDSLRINIAHSMFLSNRCVNNNGGGLYISPNGNAIVDVLIKQTIFDQNTADYAGGGIYFDPYFNLNRMSYAIDSSVFSNNISKSFGGAIGGYVLGGMGSIGSLRNCQFSSNTGLKASGAIYSYAEKLLIENCLFAGNFTQGSPGSAYNGGGAIRFDEPEDVKVRNSIFRNNVSDQEAGAILILGGTKTLFENVLFEDNLGGSTISNNGRMQLINTTFVDNDLGLFLLDSSHTEIQNSIFKNRLENLFTLGNYEVVSKGGNISSDGTMASLLTGYGSYEDVHNTDPVLDLDYFPLAGSPCLDAGNPEGVTSVFDLAGNPRIQGAGIDIGSYESFVVATHDAVWDNPNFIVFPNPANEIIHFKMENEWSGNFKMRIFNSIGQLVDQKIMSKSSSTQTFLEPVQDLSPGEYTLLVNAGNVSYATSIIIQR